MSKDLVVKQSTLNKHAAQCAICLHDEREDIELDYLHCVPFSAMLRRYGLCKDDQIFKHAQTTGLEKKRDRKQFYWRVIEASNFTKVTLDHAIEAAKQLDRLEHKIDEGERSTNIQVVYQFPMKEKSDGTKGGQLSAPRQSRDGDTLGEGKEDLNRLPASPDSTGLPLQ